MMLETWMIKNGLTDEQMAKRINASASGVQKWRLGLRIPRPTQLKRISEITDGQVTANDFVRNYSKGERK